MAFSDIVGSTQLPEHHSPEEVVALLNRFFAVVVEVVGEHGGWVNKFEGDAALCIFGAPVALPARSLILIPRCQLKMTGRTCPAIGYFGCIAAVKVETRISPAADVS